RGAPREPVAWCQAPPPPPLPANLAGRGACAARVPCRSIRALSLAAARLRHIAGTAWSTKRYQHPAEGNCGHWSAALVPWGTESALAQAYPPLASSPPLASNPPSQNGQYSSNEVIDAGHRFFGTISRGLAEIVEKAGSQWGLPNGYVLGQEAGGAWVAGLRYGEGMLYTKNAGDRRVYWQGPSLGFDFGGDGARTMMLVYDLPATDAIY